MLSTFVTKLLSMTKSIPSYVMGIVMVLVCSIGITVQSYAAEEIPTAESILWSVAQKKNLKESYDIYLALFPEGKFANLARAAANKIRTEQLGKAENAAWTIVQNSEDSIAMQKFIDKYPKGAHLALAKIRLANIHKVAEYKPGQSFKGCVMCPEMVIVPAGSFTMGEGSNAHRVSFAAPFAIGKKEVTQKEWVAIMGGNPSKFKDCDENCPVDNVSWNDAQEFVKRLNVKTGKAYRLPSEAEWEYACRAGVQQEYCGSNEADGVAWYGVYSAADKKTTRASRTVATKKANAWGLFDMSGNVAEWTEDGYHQNFDGAPADGTAWKGDGRGYLLRGGSWEGNLAQVRAAYRDLDGPSNRDVTYGFRIARKFP